MALTAVVITKFRKLFCDSDMRELLVKSGSSLVIRSLGVLATYALTWMVAHRYGISTWGTFMLSFTVVQLVTLFSRLGIDKALMIAISRNHKNGNYEYILRFYGTAVRLVLPLSVLFTLIVYGCAAFISKNVFAHAELAVHLRIAACGIPALAFLMLNAESLRGFRKISWYSFFEKGGYFMATMIVFLLLTMWMESAVAIEMSFVLALYILAVISYVKLRRLIPVERSETRSIPGTTPSAVIHQAFPLMLAGSAFLIMSWIDTIVLGIYGSESEVGIFNVAARIASFNAIILLAVNSFSGPRFSELQAGGHTERLQRDAGNSTQLIFLASLPFFIIILLFPSWLLSLFGDGLVSEQAILCLRILAAGECINALCGSVGLLLQMTGRQKAFQHIILSACALNIALSIWLIPRYGMVGAAVANAIATAGWNIASVLYIRRHLGFLTIYNPFNSRP